MHNDFKKKKIQLHHLFPGTDKYWIKTYKTCWCLLFVFFLLFFIWFFSILVFTLLQKIIAHPWLEPQHSWRLLDKFLKTFAWTIISISIVNLYFDANIKTPRECSLFMGGVWRADGFCRKPHEKRSTCKDLFWGYIWISKYYSKMVGYKSM